MTHLCRSPGAVSRRSCACVVAAVLVSACGAESPKNTVAGQSAACAGESAVAVAVRDYIKNATPSPQRFLSAAGTDSAVPEDGFAVLQDKGPSFYYSSDTVAQQKMRTKLENDGPYPSLLVVYHGKTASAAGDSATVSLGGHYVSGAQHGTVSPTRQIALACDSVWKVANGAATR